MKPLSKNLTNRKIIIKTLNYLLPLSGHIDVRNTIWGNYPQSKQLELRKILLIGELIDLDNDGWKMKLTAKGMTANPYNIDKDGNYVIKNADNIDKEDVMQFLYKELQPQSIEDIMIGICGESERYNIPLSKKINQIIEKFKSNNEVLEKHREERRVDGLPYIQGAQTYYLSHDATQHMGLLNNTSDEEIGEVFIAVIWGDIKKGTVNMFKFIYKWMKIIVVILTFITLVIGLWKLLQERSPENKKSTSREYYPSK